MRTICRTIEQMNEAVEWCGSCDLLAVDIETIPHISKAKRPQPDVITVVSYSGIKDGVIRSYAFQLTRMKSSLEAEHPLAQQALNRIAIINANPVRKTLQNGGYDCAWFLRYAAPLLNYAYDSMTLWWSRFPDLPKTLSFIASVVLDDYRYWKQGRKEEDFTSHTMYAMDDTEITLRVTLRLLEWASEDKNMLFNFHRAHLRCLTGLAMSMKGMRIDRDVLNKMNEELEEKAEKALARLRFLIDDPDFNPNSPKQKLTLFYDYLGAKKRNAKNRILKGANPKGVSVGNLVLKSLRSEHPVMRRVVDALQTAQEPAKQISNVIGMEHRHDRFHTGYDGIGTTTERLSSRKDAFNYGGNAQNLRKKFRRFACADEDMFIIEGDFSAADDIFVSYESEEAKKIEIIELGYDTHSFNAAEVFFPHWSYQGVVDGKKAEDDAVVHPITGIRQITKKLTHGANYLMAGLTLLNSAGREAIVGAAKQLGHHDAGLWNLNQLVEFCEYLDMRYRQYYPRFARAGSNSYYAELSIALRQHGSFTTIFGYRQRFLNDPMDDSTLRACAATTGQANTAGRVNMAMLELDQGIRTVRFRDGEAPDADERALRVSEIDHGFSLRLQTHDSLTGVVDPRHSNWEEGIHNFFHVMKRPVVCKGRIIKVGIEVDCAIHWAHGTKTVRSPEDVFAWAREVNLVA